MIRIEQIISEYKSYHPDADVTPLQKAYILSARLLAQPGLVWASSVTEHLEVAQILVQLRLDVESIVAGLLYSTIKDKRTNLETLGLQIGEPTAKIIQALDELPGLMGDRETKEELALAMKSLVDAATKDPRVIFVKLAVRLVRLRHWSSLRGQKTRRFASETLEIFAPLAERLGLNHIKVELEDHCFALLNPKEFAEVQSMLAGKKELHQTLLDQVQGQLKEIIEAQGIKAEIFRRIKHCYSIHLKALKYKIRYEDVHDLLGLRVIVEDKDKAYQVLGLVHERFRLVEGRFKDYITYPKANGYQSLHTMVHNEDGVGFEVQIRTQEMHKIAEMGVAAHWAYKATLPNKNEKSANSLYWLNDLSKSLTIASDPKESLEIFTRELYSDLVYAFTPKGRIIKLPAGSTVLDFAYFVHSDLGNQCTGAKIDGKVFPIQHKLHHGDQVTILTEEHQQPAQAWLGYARTNRALSQIRQGLRKREYKEAQKLGREIFEEQVRRFEIQLEDFVNSVEFKKFLDKRNYSDLEAFCTQLGFGNASMNELKLYLLNLQEDLPKKTASRLSLPFGRKEEGILLPGMEGILVRLAKCCNPLAGDAITGLMVQGEGVSVHQNDCKNIQGIDPKRLVEAHWVESKEQRLTVKLLLHFDQDIKTHLQIMKIFASAKVTLLDCRHRLVENKSTEEITCLVASLDQLSKILNRLNSLNPVTARRVFETG
ncbi:MAG: hypothetical protein A2600_12405 [Candidatus Lambdaproteobacteria bacterium RIFOXYD1_FULL_56_27]|nr:MAG: hypothetical protein A2426_00010 [Candidatus Lambdaproteobacteria bacterium RIFOXYC1_FULL_56_13]OGH06442.1 MAG: hypothetical protein A2600_12405 [Candidatus Lambdaproteobacteria bacterium RIFOXYD1_FULL_56_27]